MAAATKAEVESPARLSLNPLFLLMLSGRNYSERAGAVGPGWPRDNPQITDAARTQCFWRSAVLRCTAAGGRTDAQGEQQRR